MLERHLRMEIAVRRLRQALREQAETKRGRRAIRQFRKEAPEVWRYVAVLLRIFHEESEEVDDG